MSGLRYEQVTELLDRVEEYLQGWQPVCGRRREMELFDAVLATLFYYRHNCSQDVIGAAFGVSQPTISRMITILEEPIAAALDCEVPELIEVISGRVVIPDGASSRPATAQLIPSCTPASAIAAGQPSRSWPVPTAGCAKSVSHWPGALST